jgi:hypothetical protein
LVLLENVFLKFLTFGVPEAAGLADERAALPGSGLAAATVAVPRTTPPTNRGTTRDLNLRLIPPYLS